MLIYFINSNIKIQNYDLKINCILQNPNKPIVFLKKDCIKERTDKLLVIDISCDKGMAFDFAQPTSFEMPLIEDERFIYYSVDHTPSYYWNTASFEISGALIPYLKYIINNNGYKGNEVLEKAVDIENGVIKNQSICFYQRRSLIYPHEIV